VTGADGGWHDVAPTDFWEERYAGAGPVWSGRANEALVAAVTPLPPGRALDLGCGEGGDALWLAGRGWRVLGVDIAPTAVARAQDAAAAAGLAPERARFAVADLSTWEPTEDYDLITASFLHSPVALPREEILRAMARRVAPGGHLLLITHAAPPPGSAHDHGHERFPGPEQALADLALPEAEWETVLAQVRPRQHPAAPGAPAFADDVVLLLRRR
jgi:SAM-dependent methyltransferase